MATASRAVLRAVRGRLLWLAALAGGAVLLAACGGTRLRHQLDRRVDRKPEDVAHALADFSLEPALDSRVGAWSVLEESAAGGGWRYSVRYTCGAGCQGVARVSAGAREVSTRRRECAGDAGWWCVEDECRAEVSGGGWSEVCVRKCEAAARWWWGLRCSGGGLASEREGRATRLLDLLADSDNTKL